MARPPDLNPPLLLAHAFLCLVLCGTTIGTQSLAQQSTDGPVSVNLGDVFRKDSVKIEDASLTSLPPLPQGYAALNNKAYRITTDTEAVGPYKVTFKVSSITDEEIFRNLRIFHAEPDKFDPDSLLWVDRTAIPPNAPAHDFKQKTIHAYSDELDPGFYIIGRLVEQISPSTAVADLEVVAKGVPESVQMPSNNSHNTGSDLTLTAEAIHPSGLIRSLEFFTVGIWKQRYTIKIPSLVTTNYSIEAVAADNAGLLSKSPAPRLELTTI